MSIITHPLPDFVEVDGKKYRIHTDFRRWIELGSIMSDGAIPIGEKIVKAAIPSLRLWRGRYMRF